MSKSMRLVATGVLALGAILSVPAEKAEAVDIGNCWVSTVCTYNDVNRKGHKFTASGWSSYTNVDRRALNQVSSWANANNYQNMYLGDWVNGKRVTLNWLKASYYENWIGHWANDRADFVAHG